MKPTNKITNLKPTRKVDKNMSLEVSYSNANQSLRTSKFKSRNAE
jgi:hypothetical protein